MSSVPDPCDTERDLHQLDHITATNLVMDVIEPKLADLDDILDSADRKKKLMKLLIEGLIILQAAEDNQPMDDRL